MTDVSNELGDEWTGLLKAIPFLQTMADKVLKDKLILGKIPQAEVPASLVEVADADYVIREGEFGDTFYVVLNGQFGVEVWNDDGVAVEVTTIGRGSYFGELAMIGRGMRSASVKAKGAGCQVLEIYKGPFDRVIKDDKTNAVKNALEAIYARRTIEKFVRDNDYLRELSEVDKKLMVDTGKLVRIEAFTDVYKAGDPPKSFYLVRQGFLKVWRMEGELENILAYMRDMDFFGDLELVEGRQRTATVTSMEPVELVELPRSVFAGIYQRYPDLIKKFRRYELDRRAELPQVSSKTGMMFVKDLIESGMGQARSALIINMDLCTRCGNCVQACSDLHQGYSRLIRRGKKLTHRDEGGGLENLFFPNSCVHCRTPDCMTGCPVGSIARDKDGEVYIKDFCVGCGACAKGCEFGNISMVVAKDAEGKEIKIAEGKLKRKASKCDICKGYEQANCVYNCPQGAIIRIDPNEYFDELHRSDRGVDLVGMAQGG
jgi:CRP-like cAMP-binding protein/Fe-S-cluster-containing dehydrogenase component